MKQVLSHFGKTLVDMVDEIGYAFMLLFESVKWMLIGKQRRQAIRLSQVAAEAVQIGVRAVPIVCVLAFAVGMMLAIQGIASLKAYGAEVQVIMGIAISVHREFASLIVGVLVAGRSGSAITARIGTMKESQEIDALSVIGIDPVRYLAAPILIATVITMPALTILGDVMGLLGGALYAGPYLNLSIDNYLSRSYDILQAYDVAQGLIKSVVFAIIIVLVSVSNGFQVHGGSVGVGRATTRSVVVSISVIVVADMIFTYFLTR